MFTFIFLAVVSVICTGLSEGAGVLPADALDVAVGGAVMFNTSLAPLEPTATFDFLAWTANFENIITSTGDRDTIRPGYQGRVTLDKSTGSLELRQVTLKDSGIYQVTISIAGDTKTGQTTLSVHEPISDVKVRTSATDLVEFRASVRLSCSSSGSSPAFLWLNGSSEVTAGEGVHLDDSGATLTITNVTRYDQGPFRCRVANPVSAGTSAPVTLSISFGPENVNVTPLQRYYEAGTNISLTCSAVSRPDAEFQWFLNAVLQTASGPELRLANVQMSQSGNYSCQALNNKTGRRETSEPAVISVLQKISGASVESTRNTTLEGSSVNLTCDASGSVFTRRWTKDGADLAPHDNVTLNADGSVLSFESLRRTDSGEYACRVANPIGHVDARYILVVNYGPDNVLITGPSEAYLSQSLQLTCSAESSPPASYTWLVNATEVLANSSVFTKELADLSDGGNYTCQAANAVTLRTAATVHRLSVTEKPPPSCSTACIAGIVIACCAVVGLCAGGGYYISKKRKQKNLPANTSNGGQGMINTAYTQETTYANIMLGNKGQVERPQPESKEYSSVYSEVKVNSRPTSASFPPAHNT